MHLEEESAQEEEYINGDDPDDIEGVTEEFIVCLTRAVKDAQQVEKCCYHCGSPDHFICDCPLLVGSSGRPAFKPEVGDSTKEGSLSPSRKGNYAEGAPDGTSQL